MLTLDIENQYQQDGTPSNDKLQQWAALAYLNKSPAEAALVIVDNKAMQTLNHDYRKINKATNVLSFSANIDEVDGVTHLGDIVVCAPIIRSEAQQQDKSITEHWAHILIHGMLHLQNYDHDNNEAAAIMESIEINLLAKLGFGNPYAKPH